MIRRTLTALFALLLLTTISAAAAEGSNYSDVPPTDWSVPAIQKATEYGLMQGVGDGAFGFGRSMDRASFVKVLCSIFGWAPATPAAPSYRDCKPDAWYYSAVETALANGVLEPGVSFRPGDDISREDMAVMVIRALDYDQLAADFAGATLPFPDVTANRGYIALAYRFGIINGIPEADKLFFYPSRSAPREQVAAILVRTYEKHTAKIDWLHGFYAFNSYPQIDLTAQMDGVSVGWARLSIDPVTGPFVNQTSAGGNDWTLPKQAALATDVFQKNGTPYNLCIYSSGKDLSALLATPEAQAKGVAALVAVAGDYAGLTIDFEGLKAPSKAAFTGFMSALRAALPAGKTLYVCVQPPEWKMGYAGNNGYDFRALGQSCDKVIMMAHDYQRTSVPAGYLGTGKTDNPVTPFAEVCNALSALTDPQSGVEDRSKIALAVAIASTGFQVDEKGNIASETIANPGIDTLAKRLRQPEAQRGWSDVYRNPYLSYTADDGKQYRVWYEDAQSVGDKVALAQMFGINGVSLWRIGNLPNDPDPALHYDVWGEILK
ncbi:MAG: S-layer homology domain-containing protein, partial [Pseudoflavonifractor sp.]